MRVVTGGSSFELGDTEATPTIGIVDYSRRETDDFGVTTVVQRAFARRMSVRMSVPLASADALQLRLADLRATSALWIADERFASLSVTGFYKDFEIDIAQEPMSFCTLSVEGLALAEALTDSGADPAPAASSTFRMLRPATITDAAFAGSSIAEGDAPQWAAGTNYSLGTRVLRGSAHRVYESASAGNVGNDPTGTSGKWLDIGPTNRWAPFDEALGTVATAAGEISFRLAVAGADALALLDVTGTVVRVLVQQPGQPALYDRELPVAAGAMVFGDLPAGNVPVKVTITGSGQVSVGTLLLGHMLGLGVTEASPTAGITDFSRKDVDDFGDVTIVERAWAKRMSAKTLISTTAVDDVFSRIAGVRARPVLWIGQDGFQSLTLYGFFKDFGIEVGETVSKVSLSIEGLSTAAAASPGFTVPWVNVLDTQPTTNPRPANGATNTGDPNSPFGGSTVGAQLSGLAAAQSLIAAARADIDGIAAEISDTIGDIGNLGAEVSAARQQADTAVAQAGSLATGLAAEVARAQAEDGTLHALVSTAQSTASGAAAGVSTETTIRAAADGALGDRIDSVTATAASNAAAITSEAYTRATIDGALSVRIDSVTATTGSNSAAIVSEAGTRADADGALSGRIDSVTATTASNAAAIGSEAVTRASADGALGVRIDTVVATAAGNTAAIQSEAVTRASTDASIASRLDTVTATATPATLNRNADFNLYTSPAGTPDLWSPWDYTGGQPVRVSGINGSTWACHFDVAESGPTGILQVLELPAGKYAVEVTADLTAGSWDGAGLLVGWGNDTGGSYTGIGGQALNFLTAKDTAEYIGNNGFRRTWPMYVDTGVNGSINRLILYAMANWSGFGASMSGKGVTFRSVRLRNASAGEIAGQRADVNATLALAQITTEQSTRATFDSAQATLNTTVQAQLAGSSPSGLSGSIATVSNTATAAVSQAAAVASTAASLQVALNGLTGTVSQQAGALATAEGKLALYWQVQEITPQGIARVALVAANGTSTFLIDATNTLISGNLIVVGTITAHVFKTDEGVDLAAIVPGSLNFRASAAYSGDFVVNNGDYPAIAGTGTFAVRHHRLTYDITITAGGGGQAVVHAFYNTGGGWGDLGPAETIGWPSSYLDGGATHTQRFRFSTDATFDAATSFAVGLNGVGNDLHIYAVSLAVTTAFLK